MRGLTEQERHLLRINLNSEGVRLDTSEDEVAVLDGLDAVGRIRWVDAPWDRETLEARVTHLGRLALRVCTVQR